MWGNYKPKSDFYFTFYGKQEYFFNAYEMNFVTNINYISTHDIKGKRKVLIDLYNKYMMINDESVSKENLKDKEKIIYNRAADYRPFGTKRNLHHLKSVRHGGHWLWPYHFHEMTIRDYSVFFNSVYIPDLAFMGSPTWFYDIDLLQLDHSIKSDAIMGDRYEDDQMH